MKKLFDHDEIIRYVDSEIKFIQEFEEQKKKDREAFLSLLLDDEVIKNNRKLQEKYMELYDKFGINSLDKQMPKKPAYQGEHEKCPTCGSFYIEDYCAKCGQRIDWE